ncbi:MAG: 1-acyl-sn-glycerol-3-phosphate acyltransferase [Myxococcota bacterium]
MPRSPTPSTPQLPTCDLGITPGRPTARGVWILRRLVLPVVRLAFRPTLHGVEHLPPPGQPYLLVANHSAGLGLAELSSFAALYVHHVGPDRPLAGFAHPIGFRFWPLTAIHRQLGSVPSTYEAAFDALDAGVPLLVFPGGDHETLRPIWQANHVDFGGRRGFLRIARQAQVPIVPMGIHGSHYTVPMLWRSRALAWWLVVPRLVGLKRWGISLLGVVGAVVLLMVLPLPLWARVLLAWYWLSSPLALMPIVPWTIRFRIGPPLTPQALFQEDDETLSGALDQVQSTIQQLVVAP